MKGPGVVGEQPLLEQGQSFEYTSACPLGTSVGTMRGSYHMISQDGEEFDVKIAPFTLVRRVQSIKASKSDVLTVNRQIQRWG